MVDKTGKNFFISPLHFSMDSMSNETSQFQNFTETSQEKTALPFWNEASVVAAKGDILEDIRQVHLNKRGTAYSI